MHPPLLHREGRAGILFLAPHGYAPLERAVPFLSPDDAVQRDLAERVADWHDLGTEEALIAATEVSGYGGLQTSLPRALVDLNRGWRGRVEERETLFGKGALDSWVRTHLRGADALVELEAWYRAAMAQIRAAASGARLMVELHSYGDLGSTYDRNSGGRPMLRSEVSIVHGAPWATSFPVGLARFIPADLRGTPRPLEAAVGVALDQHTLALGPSPYPILLPWNLSARFLAERWFSWLGRSGRLPTQTAERLADLAWTDEQHDSFDRELFPGAHELEQTIHRWSHDGSDLVRAFHAQDGSATLGMELRIDLRGRATAFGAAVAEACVSWLEAHSDKSR